MSVTECLQFQVTQNSDLEISNVEVEDFAMALFGMVDRPDLRFPKFTPGLPKVLEEHQSIFAAARIKAYVLLATPNVLVPRAQ